MKVLRVQTSDTYPIRSQILRQGRPIEDCVFEGDEEEQTFHLGAFVDGKLVSVASFYFQNHPKLQDPYQYRLRGMATLAEYRSEERRVGQECMSFPIIKQNMCHILWCNARKSALGFYQKVGFEKMGEEFDIPEIGPHYLVFRKIT